jgi:hypothetical protein
MAFFLKGAPKIRGDLFQGVEVFFCVLKALFISCADGGHIKRVLMIGGISQNSLQITDGT